MKSSLITVFLMAILGAGCGKGSSDPVAKMKGFRDEMCACAKSATPGGCVAKINVAEKQWEESLDEKSMTQEQGEEADKVKAEFRDCRELANGIK